VDNFGVKYIDDTHVHHLIKTLKADYKIDKDWEGTRYLGLAIDWDYQKREVNLTMPGYIDKALARFNHEAPKKPQHQPHEHNIPIFGATIQYAKQKDTTKHLPKEDKKFIQQILGTLLYYGRAVDSIILVALSTIASAQATPTKDTMQKTKFLLDYVATHPDAVLTFKASDMVLAVHSNALYLSKVKARSQVGGNFFCSNNLDDPPNNGLILNISQIIKAIMSSAAETELGALYINARGAIPLQHLLEEMRHKQPPTPIQANNSTALGVVTNSIQPRHTKAMDMRYHWLCDHKTQDQFKYYRCPRPTNRTNYWTKHHCTAHHIK
jgi:hypothetical protein